MKDNRRKKYFVKQKLLGLSLIILAIITAILTEGDITLAFILVPIGLGIIFTKEMVLMNDYYYEMKRKRVHTDKEEH